MTRLPWLSGHARRLFAGARRAVAPSTGALSASVLLAGLALTGCADGGTPPAPTPLGADARPALGPQIDRAGRPAVSTALIVPFAPYLERGVVRDRYNRASPAQWSEFEPELANGLGILDALDGTCGNQLLAAPSGSARYAMLASILADDRLYLNASRGVCGTYLGVEAEVVGALPEGAGGCGGRTPNDDVIERSYSVLAAGVLSGVDDGVPGDARDHSTESFPFIAEPN